MSTVTERTLHRSTEQFFCTSCGGHYEKEMQFCQHCGNDSITPLDKTTLKAYGIDICKIKLLEVLKIHLKSPVPFFFLPLVMLIVLGKYFLGKVSGKGWINPNFEGDIKLWKPVSEEDLVVKPSVQNAIVELEQLGFSEVQRVSIVSLYPETVCHRFEYSDKNCFAFIMTHSVTKEYAFSRFTAFTEAGTLVMYDNAIGTVAECDSIIEKHFPGTSQRELFKSFQLQVDSRKQYTSVTAFICETIPHTRKQLEAELASGALIEMRGDEVTKATSRRLEMCAKHSMAIAVRRCSTCGTNLCEQCVEVVGDEVFCLKCKPTAESVVYVEEPEVILIPAGRSPRFMAILTDLILITAGVGTTLWFSTRLGELSQIVQTTVVTLFLCLYALFAYKQKRSIGKALWGVQIKDADGFSEADTTSHFVRVAYKVAAFLFLFPLLTYLSLFLNKKGVAVHDKLSTTSLYVKSKRTRIIARFCAVPAFVLFLLLFAVPYVLPLLGLFKGSVNEDLTTMWEIETSKSSPRGLSAPLMHNDTVLSYETKDSLFVVHSETGRCFWHLPKGEGEHFLRDSSLWGTGVLYRNNDSSFTAFDIYTGDMLWQHLIEVGDKVPTPNVLFQREHILVYSNSEASMFNRGGELLWSKRLHTPEEEYEYNYDVTLKLNEGVLLLHNRDYERNTMDISFFSLESGDLLWQKNSQIGHTLFSASGGVEIFKQGESVIAFDLRAQRPLWKQEGDFYTVFAEIAHNNCQFLFTDQGVMDKCSGDEVWKYPGNAHFLHCSDSILLLQEVEGGLFSVDISSWKEGDRWHTKEKQSLRFIGSSDSTFVFQTYPHSIFSSKTHVVIANRERKSMEKVLLGSGYLQLVDNRERRVILKTANTLGAYTL